MGSVASRIAVCGATAHLGELQQVVPVRPLDRRAHDEEVVLVPLHAPVGVAYSGLLMPIMHLASQAAATAF